jgi:type VI secretion system protein ImpE
MTAADHLHAGDLPAAVAAAVERVKPKPGDRAARWQLAELLLLSGDLQRADTHLANLDAGTELDAPAARTARQLVRAEAARREVFAAGRVPEFLETPPEHVKRSLAALLHLRAGDAQAVAEALEAAEAARPAVSAQLDGQPAHPVRDLDDITAGVLEALSPTGDYYWVPWESIAAVEFTPPARPRDLWVRGARWSLKSGHSGMVFVPVAYPGSAAAGPAFALARQTDYTPGPPVRGVGQRELLVGDDVVPLLGVKNLTFVGMTA